MAFTSYSFFFKTERRESNADSRRLSRSSQGSPSSSVVSVNFAERSNTILYCWSKRNSFLLVLPTSITAMTGVARMLQSGSHGFEAAVFYKLFPCIQFSEKRHRLQCSSCTQARFCYQRAHVGTVSMLQYFLRFNDIVLLAR